MAAATGMCSLPPGAPRPAPPPAALPTVDRLLAARAIPATINLQDICCFLGLRETPLQKQFLLQQGGEAPAPVLFPAGDHAGRSGLQPLDVPACVRCTRKHRALFLVGVC